MKSLFVSDDYYLATGIDGLGLDSFHLSSNDDVNQTLWKGYAVDVIIVAVYCEKRRQQIVSAMNKYERHCIVLLQDIMDNHHFKVGNITYASFNCSIYYLKRIIIEGIGKPAQKFTRREMQILSLFHLRNADIAKKFNISQKTASGYRISIQNKLRMKSKNNIANIRLKNILCLA